jgi:hypothetical protein
MHISIKLCTHWANRWWSRWDTTDAAVESVHSGEFPLQRWQFLHIWNRNADITKFLRVLLACGKFHAQNTRFDKTNWPSTLHVSHRITFKDSTDTFLEQVQFTDSHRFFWKGSQKVNCLSVYANEQSNPIRLLARPLSDKSLPHVTFNPHVQWQSQPIPFVMHYTWQIYVGIVKLAIYR